MSISLFYHRLYIRVVATEDTNFDAWTGAVLRNNLLYAAEQTFLPEENISLYKYINRFTLEEKHPLYKQLSKGFPLPYYLFLHHPVNISSEETLVRKNEIISFSLVLIGPVAKYFQYFIESLRYMCNRGFGLGMKQFELLDIYEVSPKGKRIVAATNEDFTRQLLFPVYISDFEENNTIKPRSLINIVFESPVCLIKQKNKDKKNPGFQEKSNAFPSFYQLVRTAAYRFAKLNILYAHPDDFEAALKIDEEIEEYINDATKFILESAEIKKVSLQSTIRERTETRIPLEGYIGTLSFRGNYKKYIPLLKFMEELGVGHELVYGLGKYKIK
ncbi:MAG: CRISPR system precrRNA processing endoribonuclease RAMP protein Cas6 [Bacteroidales bacterium]|nr:CRISPR system precrRNA processing endoribonuclease RAMP protein Cas6 [Bacteroidales bacterium]